MTRGDVDSALPLLGLVGAMGLFLPSLESAWDADPSGDGKVTRVRRGEQFYLGSVFALGALASYAKGNPAPLLLCTGFAIAVVVAYEHALRASGPAPSQA